MDLTTNFQMFALYNQHMNRKLIDACNSLSEEQLNQPTGAFFSTIMDHWNHILFGDLIMLQRLMKNGFANVEDSVSRELPVAKSVNDKYVSTLKELSLIRETVDSILLAFTQSLNSEKLQRNVVYKTTEGQDMSRNLSQFCAHLFNHQTHHRGQITCLLSQSGVDYGSTDLPVVISE